MNLNSKQIFVSRRQVYTLNIYIKWPGFTYSACGKQRKNAKIKKDRRSKILSKQIR